MLSQFPLDQSTVQMSFPHCNLGNTFNLNLGMIIWKIKFQLPSTKPEKFTDPNDLLAKKM